MINVDYITNEIIKEYNPNWPQICDDPYRSLVIRSSRNGKTNALLHLIIHQPDIYKIYLYAKDLYEAKYQLVINKRESVDLKDSNDSKAFTEYLNDRDDIHKNIREYNPNKECKILIIFWDML